MSEQPVLKEDGVKRFRVEPGVVEDKAYPKLNAEELDAICDMTDITAADKDRLRQWVLDKQPIVTFILGELAERDLANELPVEEETFTYKRNIQRCLELQQSVKRLIDLGQFDPNDETSVKLLEDASILFWSELKKVDWLEREFYPAIFEQTLKTARAEVMQFQIGKHNLGVQDEIKATQKTAINLLDPLNYVAKGNPAMSSGCFHFDNIDLKIPSDYTDKDSWRVYLTAVHELLHSISYRSYERLGIQHRDDGEVDYEEINEAITEILTFVVAKDHLSKYKTPLEGEDVGGRKLTLDKMGYDVYTFIVKQIFSKVPMEYFTDAMLNKDGLDRLRAKFEEAFEDPNKFWEYGRNLARYYNPKKRS